MNASVGPDPSHESALAGGETDFPAARLRSTMSEGVTRP